jgi:hypothetical protein
MTVPHHLVVSPLWLLPLWLIFLIVAATLLVAHELGVQLRRRTSHWKDQDTSDEGVGGSYLTASLALLALLVGFSFGMAVDRYNKRSGLVADEANAISTVHRRLQILAEPERSRLFLSFVPYVEAREAFSRASTPDHLTEAERRTDALQGPFWSTIVQTLGTRDPAARAALDATNDMFNLAASRRGAVESVIPPVILFALLLYAAIAAIFMGYSHPLTRRYFLASSIQFVLLSLAFALVVDLDRPRTGLVEVSQAPLYRVAAAVRREVATPRGSARAGDRPDPRRPGLSVTFRSSPTGAQ